MKLKDITLDEWNTYFDPIGSQEELDEKLGNLSELERAEICFHFPEIEDEVRNRAILNIEHHGKVFGLELMEADPDLRNKALLLRTPKRQWIILIKHHLKSRMTDNQVILDEIRRVHPKGSRIDFDSKDIFHAVSGVLKIFLHRWEDIATKIYDIINEA